MGLEALQERFNPLGRWPRLRVVTVIGIILSAISINESLLYLGYLDSALWGYFILFVGCTLAPILTVRATTTNVFRALTLVPLFRLLNLGVPLFVGSTLAWLPLVYGPLLMAAYILADDLPAVDLPTARNAATALLYLPIVLAGAALLASVEYMITEPAALVESGNVSQFVLLVFVMVGFVGFVEEFIFRGILQRTFEAYAGRITGIGVSSLVFGAMHSSLQLPAEIGFGIGIGVVFALLYDQTNNLVLVTFLHGLMNIFLFALFPIFGPVIVL